MTLNGVSYVDRTHTLHNMIQGLDSSRLKSSTFIVCMHKITYIANDDILMNF